MHSQVNVNLRRQRQRLLVSHYLLHYRLLFIGLAQIPAYLLPTYHSVCLHFLILSLMNALLSLIIKYQLY